MLQEIARALAATLVVAVVPGYPWARRLAPGADLPERLAWACALSLALVPTAALGLTSLLGGGLTFPIAAAAVLLVLGTGIAVGMRAPEGIVAPRYPVPPTPRLWRPVLLAVALACVALLLVALGRVPVERAARPLVFLLLAAPLLQLVGWVVRRRRASGRPAAGCAERGGTGRGAVLGGACLGGVLLLVLLRAYVGPARHDWPYVRGVDQYSHTVLANLTAARGTTEGFLAYPPGFPALTAVMSHLGGLEPLRLYAALAPALLVLPALSCYVLARRLWGWEYGVAAAAGAGLLVGGPYAYFHDAMYPHLLGAQFLLVLAVAALVSLVGAPSRASALLFALLGSSVVLYHTVATLYLALLLGVVAAPFLGYLLWRDRRAGAALAGSLALLGVLSVAYAWEPYDLPRTVGALLGRSSESEATGAAAATLGTQPPHGLPYLAALTSAPVLWFGMLGALLALPRLRRAGRAGALAVLVLCAWCLLLYVGSRTQQSGFPQRFARDLGVPLAVLAAYGFVAPLRSAGIRTVSGGALAVLGLWVVALQAREQVRAADRVSYQLLLTPEIEAAGRWLRAHNRGGRIIVSPHVNQVPSRAMLAMGGYEGLQSYAPWQLAVRRDLPPGGPRPLEDVLWVVKHPDPNPRTREILRRYDVRYVVIYRRFHPRSFWYGKDAVDVEPFERASALYRRAYANDGAIVYEVRAATGIPRSP